MLKTAVIYHYFEKNETYADNAVFFLSRAWRPDIAFFFLIAGGCSRTLPERDNLHYLEVENYGHDFGSYSKLAQSGALDRFDRLIFVNNSARGPFLPTYVTMDWTEPFLSPLAGDTHLAGVSINVLHDDRPMHMAYFERNPHRPQPYSHVQSFVFSLTAECFRHLKSHGIFDPTTFSGKNEAIVQREIEMSVAIRSHGWNITCILPPYGAIDYRRPHQEFNPATATGHPNAAGAYFGLTPHPYELVFVKTGWNVLSAEALAFHSLMNLKFHARPGLDWSASRELRARLEGDLGLSPLLRQASQ